MVFVPSSSCSAPMPARPSAWVCACTCACTCACHMSCACACACACACIHAAWTWAQTWTWCAHAAHTHSMGKQSAWAYHVPPCLCPMSMSMCHVHVPCPCPCAYHVHTTCTHLDEEAERVLFRDAKLHDVDTRAAARTRGELCKAMAPQLALHRAAQLGTAVRARCAGVALARVAERKHRLDREGRRVRGAVGCSHVARVHHRASQHELAAPVLAVRGVHLRRRRGARSARGRVGA